MRHPFSNRQLREKCTQRLNKCIYRRSQNFTTVKRRHLGREALPESDHRSTLRAHVACAEPRAAPVLPLWALQRAEPALRRYPANTLEGLTQLLLLDGQLRRTIEVLQRAAAADAKVCAAWRHAFTARYLHRNQFGVIMLAMMAATDKAHRFARQRANDESGLAGTDHACPLVVERLYQTGFSHGGFASSQPGGSQARRNSA